LSKVEREVLQRILFKGRVRKVINMYVFA
jgi:hypothetical protein